MWPVHDSRRPGRSYYKTLQTLRILSSGVSCRRLWMDHDTHRYGSLDHLNMSPQRPVASSYCLTHRRRDPVTSSVLLVAILTAAARVGVDFSLDTAFLAVVAFSYCLTHRRRDPVTSSVLLVALLTAAARVGVDFSLDTAFLAAPPGFMTISHVDLRIWTHSSPTQDRALLVLSRSFGVRPTNSRQQGATTVAISALSVDASAPLDRTHLLPRNFPGAPAWSAIVLSKFLVDYLMGSCIIAFMDMLVRDLTFHSSAFALVPKKGKPLHLDGLIIHTDSRIPLRRRTRHGTRLSRVRELRRRFPGYHIHSMIADIVDAFHHVSVHSWHASAFGCHLLRPSHAIVSGMSMFGWTSLPGFFTIFRKAVRHYQRTGTSIIRGHVEPVWSFQWVDDIVLMEVDIEDRLQQAENRLRDGIKLVFGSQGWNSSVFRVVGIDWSIQDDMITVPQRELSNCGKHLKTPWGKGGVPITQFRRKDLEWWNDPVLQIEFAGMSMRLFDRNPKIDDTHVPDDSVLAKALA
ncbi:Hypothetical protein PHPALM_21013 [Phytophthora palmivora]|uniref:Uncharacterized protein n=1 Tax=Phytophthora palmivora TaxID=4796 RepID=A0A2P4XDG0_9STRA|nr:Hypothetical protein PHPALM_21013 [Phytophthora palmivora]